MMIGFGCINYFYTAVNPLSARCCIYTIWKHVSSLCPKSETTSDWNWDEV